MAANRVIVKFLAMMLLLLLMIMAACSSGSDGSTDLSSVTDPIESDSSAIDATGYMLVDTAQVKCYDSGSEITCPEEGEFFYGQYAQYTDNVPGYKDNGDGTVTDVITGLMWQQNPDTDGDGDIDAADKLSYNEAVAGAAALDSGGYTDWRLPTIKELYSLMDFSGLDPSEVTRKPVPPKITRKVSAPREKPFVFIIMFVV